MKQTSSSIRLLLFIRSSAIPRQGRSRTSTTGGNRYRLSSDKCIGNGKNQIANRWCRQLIKQCIQFCLQTFVCVRKRFVLPFQLIKFPVICKIRSMTTQAREKKGKSRRTPPLFGACAPTFVREALEGQCFSEHSHPLVR